MTYNKTVPTCLWITPKEVSILPCIVDERICGDTFLRVEKISNLTFLVSDIWMYNSNCVFACSTFQQRYEWLKDLLKRFVFHTDTTIRLIHKSEYSFTEIGGHELYTTETAGKPGYFVEKEEYVIQEFKKLEIPDCYLPVGKRGYLRVPDLKTSLYLRSKPNTFECKCVQNEDTTWTLLENIPNLK